MKYDVIIIGAGPGGIFAAYELMKENANLKVAVFEAGHELKSAIAPSTAIRLRAVSAVRVAPS
jgi:flavin-dependent dehydrogenase